MFLFKIMTICFKKEIKTNKFCLLATSLHLFHLFIRYLFINCEI
ncbi:hypothetical protein KL86DYS2_12411 [uncultured Dysgonomonas sp.]|uniref:Uncharacterized protein n=1 Tax=uncultured Dysgonomonas sp. TaxID=206096 RepID=A0A212JV20_9BACT|nr:hypothetical protein KL86DYS2_12411 [uncultured Dysgonomonas sp.]